MTGRRFHRCLGLLVFLSVCFTMSLAQPVKVTPAQQRICDRHNESLMCEQLLREFQSTRELLGGTPSSRVDNPFNFTETFVNKAAGKALLRQIESEFAAQAKEAAQTALQTISTSAANNQNGGAPSASGSTNLVSKPTTTDFISMAAESGAFTDTINGTTMTIQANALGLTKYFANRPVFERWKSTAADAIQPLSFTVTLNLAQTGSTTATTAGSANAVTPPSIASVLLPTNNASFSSFAANYVIYRPYNPQEKSFLDSWRKALATSKDALAVAAKPIASLINKLQSGEGIEALQIKVQTSLDEWHKSGADAEAAARAHGGDTDSFFEQFVSAYSKYEDAYTDALLSLPNAPKQVLDLNNAVAAFKDAVYTVLDKARGTPLATLSYLYSAPEGKPATHNITAVASYLFKGDNPQKRTPLTGAQLTANFTTSIYATVPAGAAYGRLRDFQLSGEFDKPFGGTPAEPRGTLSLAGYGQYQYDPTVLNITAGNLVPGTNIALPGDAQVLLGTAGWLGVAQGKIVINLKQGLNIPIAVKWSNKTDLLKGSDVRGQVGLSYDLSALSKLISPSKN
jgi:hypothetical protein